MALFDNIKNRKVVLDGHGLPGLFWRMGIESANGHGFLQRIFMTAFKKEPTWYAALAELRSQVKYSQVFLYNATRRAVAQMAQHMKTDRDGNPNVFNVERNDNDLWLNTNYDDPVGVWDEDCLFVFVLPRK